MKSLSTFGLFVSIALILVLATTGCSSREEREQKYLDKARALIEQGDYVKAKLELRNVLQINNLNAEALFLRGTMAEQQQNYSNMMQDFTASAAADPSFVPVHLRLLHYYFSFGPDGDRITRATIEKILAADPENLEAIVTLGRVALREGNREEAIEHANRAKAIAPEGELPVLLLAEIYQKEPNTALEIVDSALAVNPESAKLMFAKIQLLKQIDDTDAVVRLYKQLTTANPDQPEYYQQMITYLRDNNRVQEAEDLLLDSIRENPEVSQYKVWLAQLLLSAGQQHRAIELSREYLEKGQAQPELYYLLSDVHLSLNDPSSAQEPLRALIGQLEEGTLESQEAMNRLASVLLKVNDVEAAKQYLEQILQADPENPSALITSAKIALAEGDTESAILKLRTAIKRNPSSFEARLVLARAHELDGSMDLALDNYQGALELDPGKTAVAMRIGDIYLDRDEPELAVRLLQQYLVSEKTSAVVAPKLVSILVKEKQWARATEVTDKLESQAGNHSLGLYLKGGILYEQRDFKEALKVFQTILESEPGSPKAITAIVKTLSAEENEVEVVTFLTSYIEEHPNELAPREILASVYARQGDTEKALDIYNGALKVSPQSPNLYLAIFRLQQNAGNDTEALAAIDEAISLTPGNTGLLTLKASLLEGDADYKAAAGVYESILEINADNAIAANNLAMLYADHLASKETIARALSITNEFESAGEPVFLDTRGWVLYRAGDYSNALVILKKATSDPEKVSAVYRYHLGMVYLKLDEIDKGKIALEAAINSGEHFHGMENARRALEDN